MTSLHAETPRVLVVDDTEGNRYAVSRILRGAGLTVAEAASGAEALAVAGGADLVVLDINLPDISGYDVCRRLKSDPATEGLPVMHLSASYTANADRVVGLEAGADAYLTHPVDPAVLVATVRALLRAHRAEREFHRAAREWRTTFDAIGDAIFLMDAAGTVHRCNRAAGELAGRAPAEMIGRPWASLVAELAAIPTDPLRNVPAVPPGQWDVRIRDRDYRVATHHAAGDAGQPLVACVLTDVSPERHARRELEALIVQTEQARRDAEQARGEAESANRAKSDFLAVMSHELRTPLNAIGGFTDLIAMGLRGPVTSEQEHDLQRIRRSQITLMALINDLLGFAKLESGSVQFVRERVALRDALSDAADMIEGQARAKGLRLERDELPPDLAALADPEKLQQILLNLLTNAVKFTNAGGTIRIAGAREGSAVSVIVSDTGIGIPADKQASIFDPFVQIDQGLARSGHGVGLGLAISRDLARGMNGELTVTSEPGVGSTFSLRLPGAD
jgi:signal transduction histidine kinase